MATITTTSKSGSVGPSTFATSTRYGTVERVRVKPRNPRSPAQQRHRTIVKAVAGDWRRLSEAERTSWKALARQLPGRLSGYGVYARVNITRVHCGQPRVAVAPPTPALGTLSCAGLVVAATPLVKVTGLSATCAPDKLLIEACGPVSAGVDYVNEDFCQLTVVDGFAEPAADLDLTVAYVARFGAPRAGEKVFVRLRPVKDGFKGEPVQCVAIVPARAA